jgi:hypothetical protein
LRPVNRHDGHFDILADSQGFAGSSGEYQHRCWFAMECRLTVASLKGRRCERLLVLIVGHRRTCQARHPARR